MNVLDLFSGIGGFSLGLERAGMRTVAFCEIEKYCRQVLAKHWPGVPIYDDIRRLTAERLRADGIGPIDIVCGGFPCQPFSNAGKRRGKEDDRDLWPEMFRVIQEVRPAWVLGENVAGFVNMELDRSISDLESEGYEVEPLLIPACGVDAPHRRERVWIVAYAEGERSGEAGQRFTGPTERPTGGGKVLADSTGARWRQQGGASETIYEPGPFKRFAGCGGFFQDSINSGLEGAISKKLAGSRKRRQDPDLARPAGWPAEPGLGGGFDGLSNGLDGGLSDEAKTRAEEILRHLWDQGEAETLWETIGGFECVSQKEILFAFLCEYEERKNTGWVAMERQEVCRGIMRSLWKHIESARSPLQPRYNRQFTGEFADALRKLPRKTSSLYPKVWQAGQWEDGMQRVTNGIPHRVDRLKGLGNAVVPQVVEVIGSGIMDIYSPPGN